MLRKMAYLFTVFNKVLLRLWCGIRYRSKKERKENLKILITAIEKKYLRRYLYVLQNKVTKSQSELNKIIWICWLQGEDKMPPVVKKCIESVRKQCSNYQIIIITNENISSYVSFPEYIIRKKEKGLITNTHFSDLLRVSLLTKYGGIWLDATVYLSAPLNTEILKADFFAFHVRSYVKNNSWLLKSVPNHLLVSNTQKLLLEYWKYENHLLDYFLYHIFFDLMIEENKYCADEWAKVPVLYDDCYDLEANFGTKYSIAKWHEIDAKTHIHKTSWKHKVKPEKDNFLSALLEGKLENS